VQPPSVRAYGYRASPPRIGLGEVMGIKSNAYIPTPSSWNLAAYYHLFQKWCDEKSGH